MPMAEATLDRMVEQAAASPDAPRRFHSSRHGAADEHRDSGQPRADSRRSTGKLTYR